jgi:hypothetical protein
MKAEASLGMGLATGVVVFAIYSHSMPSVVDHRVGDANDPDAGASERTARWLSAGTVAAISLIAKDPTVFVIGGAMVVALSIWHRYSNMFDPVTGGVVAPAGAAGGAPMVAVDTADSGDAYAGFE